MDDTLAESIERYRKKSIPEAMLAFTAVTIADAFTDSRSLSVSDMRKMGGDIKEANFVAWPSLRNGAIGVYLSGFVEINSLGQFRRLLSAMGAELKEKPDASE